MVEMKLPSVSSANSIKPSTPEPTSFLATSIMCKLVESFQNSIVQLFHLFINHVYTWNSYSRLIAKHRLYPNSPNNKKYSNYVVPRTFCQTGIPILVSGFMGVRGALVLILGERLDTPWKRTALGTEIFPPDGRVNIENILVCWSILSCVFMVRATGKPLPAYSFLALFVVSEEGKIKPKHLSKFC